MKGIVNDRLEAVLQFAVHGKTKAQRISAVIDTGFNGSLTLPSRVIRSLGLRLIAQSEGELADGGKVDFDIYAGDVFWNGRRRRIQIFSAETGALVGMELLEGQELHIKVVPGGMVNISEK